MKIKGVMPALVTPLCADESICLETLEKLMHDLCAEGAEGFYIGGATGEGLALREAERKTLAEAAVRFAARDGKECIVQVASMDHSEVLRLAAHAEEVGAAAISSTAPLFFAYDEDDVYAYYKSLASRVHIPVMVYYSPAAAFRMSAAFAKRLFSIDNVTSIKWTSTDFYQLTVLKQITNGEMAIINGFDEMLLSGLAAGADGGIGTTYNFELPYVKKVYEAFMCGDMETAKSYQQKVVSVVEAFQGAPVIPATKAILERKGYAVGNAAFPMKRYTDAQKDELFDRIMPLLP